MTNITRHPSRSSSLYMDQVHPADIGYRLAAAYNFPVVKSITEALTLGTGKLAVDGVLLVAEHGNYPFNDHQQQLYPRFKFFQQVVDTFRTFRAGSSGVLATSICHGAGMRRSRCTTGRVSCISR